MGEQSPVVTNRITKQAVLFAEVEAYPEALWVLIMSCKWGRSVRPSMVRPV